MRCEDCSPKEGWSLIGTDLVLRSWTKTVTTCRRVCSTWWMSGSTSWKQSFTQLFREWWRKFLKSWSSFHSHWSGCRSVWWNRTWHAAVPQIQEQIVDDMKVIHPSKALATAHSGEDRGCAHVAEYRGNFGSCANHSPKMCFEANWRGREICVDLKCWWQTRWDRWEEKEIIDVEGHGHAPYMWVERPQQSSVWGWTCEKRWPRDWGVTVSKRLTDFSVGWALRRSDIQHNRRKTWNLRPSRARSRLKWWYWLTCE